MKPRDVLQRMVKYTRAHLGDWDSTRKVLQLLHGRLGTYVEKVRAAEEDNRLDDARVAAQTLRVEQERAAELGAVDLVVRVISERPDSDVVAIAVDLGIVLLKGGEEAVQNKFMDVFSHGDESTFFRVVESAFSSVATNIGRYRRLKALRGLLVRGHQ